MHMHKLENLKGYTCHQSPKLSIMSSLQNITKTSQLKGCRLNRMLRTSTQLILS